MKITQNTTKRDRKVHYCNGDKTFNYIKYHIISDSVNRQQILEILFQCILFTYILFCL